MKKLISLLVITLLVCLTTSCKGNAERDYSNPNNQPKENIEEQTINPQSDNAENGKTGTGDASTGNETIGNAGSNNSATDNPATDDPATGNTGSNTPVTDNTAANNHENNIPSSDSQPVSSGLQAKPWINSDIKQNITENMQLSPKEDFHLYANYEWMKNTEIPAGNSSWTFFDETFQNVKDKEKALIADENSDDHDVELIQDFYNIILNWDERNETGLTPMTQLINEIRAIKSLDELTDFICDKEKGPWFSRFINVSIGPAVTDSSEYVVSIKPFVHIGPEGEKQIASTRQTTAEKKYFSELMNLAGYNRIEAVQMYDAVVERVEPYFYYLKNDQGNTNDAVFQAESSIIKTNDELKDLMKQFPLMGILEYYGVADAEKYQMVYPHAFSNLDEFYTESNLENLKKYLMVTCVMYMGPNLNQDANKLLNDYYKSLYGRTEVRSDEENALNIVASYLDVPFYKAYLRKYDATEIKERITELTEKIVDEYRAMLMEEEWLSEATKKHAIEKLDNMAINVIDPGKWDDYSGLDIKGLSYLEARQRIIEYEWELKKAKIGTICSREDWRMTVLVANAYYDSLYNSININYGIVDGEMYYDGISDEELYAGLGTVIGHEISHAFDTMGALYDKNGDYVNWWTAEDYEMFQKKADNLVTYLNGITAWINLYVDGNRVCPETIADMAGMKVILKMAEKIPDFNYREFFTAYARLWRGVITEEYDQYLFLQDAHLLNYLRTNTVVQQFDKFFETFDVREGDTMYLPPEKRVNIW